MFRKKIKDEKLEILKDMLSTRSGYSETVKKLDLNGTEKDIFLMASIEVNKKNPKNDIIDQAYDILMKHSFDHKETSNAKTLSTEKESTNKNTQNNSQTSCIKCGKKLDDEAIFCDNCGEKVKQKRKFNFKYLYLIIAVLATFFAYKFLFSNETIDSSKTQNRDGLVYKTNDTEPFSGTIIYRYRNGKLKYKRNFKAGQLDGLATGWYGNGEKKIEANFKDGQANGLLTEWYDNGQIHSETNFKDGQLDGLVTDWYKNGQKKIKANFKDDQFDGLVTEWYENGQIRKKTNFKNGQEL